MKVDDALTRWCPQTSVLQVDATGGQVKLMAGGAVAFNRLAGGDGGPTILPPPAANCIANLCMAWRWHDMQIKDGPEGRGGFCGLAGNAGAP